MNICRSVRALLMSRISLAISSLILCEALGGVPANAVVLLNENFNTSPIDGIPNSISPHPADFILGTGNPGSNLKIAGPGGTYADPFGGAGNQSLVLHSFNGGCFTGDPGCSPDLNEFPVVTWLNEFGDDPTVHRNGVIQFDIFLTTPEPSDTWTLLDLRVGWGGPERINPQTIPPDVIIWNQFQVQNNGEEVSALIVNNSFFQGQGIAFPNENPLEPEVPFRVKYTLDGSTETFQWEITNLNTDVTTPLTYNKPGGSPTEANWPWGFGPFPGAINYLGYNSVSFQQDFGNKTGAAFIDNLLVNSSAEVNNGDFNGDGRVDGRDFLQWQRGSSPNPFTAGDLELWQTNYGLAVLSASTTSIPEPTSITLLLFLGALFWNKRPLT